MLKYRLWNASAKSVAFFYTSVLSHCIGDSTCTNTFEFAANNAIRSDLCGIFVCLAMHARRGACSFFVLRASFAM